jgi:hypothetical protein
MRAAPFGATLFLTAVICTPALAQTQARTRYTDPTQLELPWPKHSFVKQPWRGFLETRPGSEFLRGVGINYNVSGNDELCVRLLAEAGIRRFRIEVGWGSVNWDESTLNGRERFIDVLKRCKQYDIRPTMLLNAHHGVPCPMKSFERKLTVDAPEGATSIRLAEVKDLVVGRSGINRLTDYCAAEVIFTAIDEQTGVCKLSRPLPKELKAEKPVSIGVLKFAPLYPVGTKEFDETANGWLRYADLVCTLVRAAGIDDFDVEIWNELSFGSKFTQIDNYYDPAPFRTAPDFLNPGGRDWELARRTVEQVRRDLPKAQCIWRFSNTTFYHCAVEKLPPGIAGQSYHPYGTGTLSYPQDEPDKGHPENNLEGFTPTMKARLPEGWAFTFLKTESLMRLLNPDDRKKRASGSPVFQHYMTEHGVVPAECGVTDAAGAWELKRKCALRSYCLWLNKGVHALHYYCAKSVNDLDMGLLPPNVEKLPPDARFEEVATPPLRAIRNLTRAFDGSAPLGNVQTLRVDVRPLDELRKVFDGPVPLWHHDVFAFLPFQVNEKRHVVAVYVATYDATKPMTEERYRLSIRGFSAVPHAARLLDPVSGRTKEVRLKPMGQEGVEAEVSVLDYPRLLILED